MPKGGVIAVTALLLLLAGCANPWQGYAPSRAQIVAGGWIGPEVAAVPASLYCYATLAKPDCYPAPQPGQAGRLVGAYGAR